MDVALAQDEVLLPADLDLEARIGREEDAIALLGAILCDAVALDPAESLDPAKLTEIREHIPRERLLAAADAAMGAIRWLAVNADTRLLVEQVVAALV